MKRKFVFVAGDLGAAQLQVPVISLLHQQGHATQVFADAEGIASRAFTEAGILHQVGSFEAFKESLEADIQVIGTSANAYRLEQAACQRKGARSVLASDGLFNYGLKHWRNFQSDDGQLIFWTAFDDEHAQALKTQHPNAQVLIVGQPAFDPVLKFVHRRMNVRREVRSELGITDQKPLALWWSQGMPGVIEEDVSMIKSVLNSGRLSFIARIHPKLDKVVRAGYAEQVRAEVLDHAYRRGIDCLDPRNRFSAEELCLAADVICSITCTEDVKSTYMGGPPVLHFFGPVVRHWMEEDLGLHPPHYMPDVVAGLSDAAYSEEEAYYLVSRRDLVERAEERLMRPSSARESSTHRFVEALLDCS